MGSLGADFFNIPYFFIDLPQIFLKYLLPNSDLRIEWERPMVITDFRVQSVLRTYTRQLQRSKLSKVDKESGDSKQSVEKVSISDDVWVGYGSIILSGIKIGQGSIIAAGSVVTKDVEPYSIYAGVPAKKVKDRFSSDIDKEKHIRLYYQR